MNHDERLAVLEATAVDMDRLGKPQRARAIRAVLVPYYVWLEAEMRRGAKPADTADTVARMLGNAVEFFSAYCGGSHAQQGRACVDLLERIADEVKEQHKGRFGRH